MSLLVILGMWVALAGSEQAVTPNQVCQNISSNGRLMAGGHWRQPVFGGLELRLDSPEDYGWWISLGPIDKPSVDYIWAVNPPYRLFDHVIIGANVGEAKAARKVPRTLRFVLNEVAASEASGFIRAELSHEAMMRRIEVLGAGRLTLRVTGFGSDAGPQAVDTERLSWISLEGTVCAPAVR
jgi:hypothetical protein